MKTAEQILNNRDFYVDDSATAVWDLSEILIAMKEYAEQEREKAFNKARLMSKDLTDEEGVPVTTYENFSDYKTENPLT